MFKRPLLNKILSGEKTQTRRLIQHKRGVRRYEVGQRVGVRAGYTKFEAYIIITKKFRQRLGDISEEDARKEGFRSVEEFKQTWVQLFGKWEPDTVVYVYEFKLDSVADLANKDKPVQQATL